MKCRIIIVLMLFFAGCSSRFKVVSEPIEAEVYLRSSKAQAEKKLGNTPLELPLSELVDQVEASDKESNFFTLEVRKEGFETQSFSLPKAQSGALLAEINVQLKKDDGKKLELKTAQDLVNQLFLAQRFALSGQFERSLIELDKILEAHPDFSRAASMKGSIYMAQKNYIESLKWYEKAIELDPKTEETVKLAAKVRELMGVRQPAGRP